MTIIKYQFTITYESSIDSETGEILDTVILEKSPLKPKKSNSKIDLDENPKLTLLDSKYQLTSGACDLLKAQANDKVDIKYGELSGKITPIIGKDDIWGTKSGNRITQSLTVSYRGNKHDELARYGSVFTLEPHPNTEGLFILNSGEELEELQGDENIDDLIEDADLEAIDANTIFQL